MKGVVERLRDGLSSGPNTVRTPWGETIEEAAAVIERLRASVDRLLICGNHIATYRSDRWPAYELDGLTRDQQCEHALRVLGAGCDYDMWCCWSGMMQERDAIQQKASDGSR